jgi:pimeloyl-ACP methyl ester carboxylesterase
MKGSRACLLAVLSLGFALPVFAQLEKLVEVPSRGQAVRTLELVPAKPVASVILLAGGDGDLGLTSEGNLRSSLSFNQLVRTRLDYARNGLATLVPDLAPDLKNGRDARRSAKHAADLGALVRHMRVIAEPVVVVGTSRGTLSAANAVANLAGSERPDAMVLTSAFLNGGESVQQIAGKDPRRLAVPTLVIGHRRDGCRFTSPAAIEPFRRWLTRAEPHVATVLLDGGGVGGNPCEANSPHGFVGVDQQVVATVAEWIKSLRK